MILFSCKSPGAVLGSGRQNQWDSQILVEVGCVSGAGALFVPKSSLYVLVAEPWRDYFVLGDPQHPQQVALKYVSMP